MVRGLSSWHALLWVAVAVAAAAAVLLAARVVSDRLRVVALAAVAVGGGVRRLCRSRVPSSSCCGRATGTSCSPGLSGGMQTLGTVRLPYASADPWPRIVLELLGTELLILAGLLTFWPRLAVEPDVRAPLAVPDRGYPFVALGVLIIVVASPVVSLGGPESLLLGLALAALSVCFLWLERLPLRPGLGVAALLAIVLAGALPLAAMADRGEPWFDYRSFAESLGPGRPRAVLVDAELRADRLAAQRQRGDAGHVARADVLEGAQPRRVRRHGVDGSRRARREPARRRTVRGRRPVELGDTTGLAEQSRLQYPPGTDVRGLRRRHYDQHR